MLPHAQEIIITRTIFTPPAQIYAAFISAEGWCEWCCEKAEVNARLGGKYHVYTVTVLGRCQDWADFAGFLEGTWGRALNNLKAVLEEKQRANYER